MANDDVLIMVETGSETGPERILPVQVTRSSFVSPDSPIVPGNHAIAQETGCVDGTCLRITVDFATPAPSDEELQTANAALSSLALHQAS